MLPQTNKLKTELSGFYTVPDGVRAEIYTVTLVNTSAGEVTATVYLHRGNQRRAPISPAPVVLPPGGKATATERYDMAQGQSIEAQASVAGAVSIVISGREVPDGNV